MKEFSVVFLGNRTPPTKLVLLKRASKRWAGDKYTGIGGKKEDGEEISETATRELKEETGLTNIALKEFAKALVNNKKVLYYFLGILNTMQLPLCTEGDLEWAPVEEILNFDIIPTTKIVLEEWQKRGFSIDRPWTMELVGEENQHGITQKIVIKGLKEDLS